MEIRAVLLAIFLTAIVGVGADAAEAEGCPGGAASAGAVVHGPVLDIPDASTLCIAQGQSPSTWVEVKLRGTGATRGALMAASFARNAVCAIGPDGVGACRIEQEPLAEALRRPEVRLAALSWR